MNPEAPLAEQILGIQLIPSLPKLGVETFETGVISDSILRKAIREVWNLRPAAITRVSDCPAHNNLSKSS